MDTEQLRACGIRVAPIMSDAINQAIDTEATRGTNHDTVIFAVILTMAMAIGNLAAGNLEPGLSGKETQDALDSLAKDVDKQLRHCFAITAALKGVR